MALRPARAQPQPFARTFSRAAAFLLDAILLAYACWGIAYLCDARQDAAWIPCVAILLAASWRLLERTLGLAGYRLAAFHEGAHAPLDRLMVACGVLALQAGGVLALVITQGVLPALGLVGAFGLLSVFVHGGDSLGERLGGVRWLRTADDDAADVTPWMRRPNVWVSLVVLGITAAVGISVTHLAPGRLFDGEAWARARRMLGELVQFDWSIVGTTIAKMIETIFIALMASVLALPFAFGLSFLGARNVMSGHWLGRAIYTVARVLMNIMRSIESLVWVIIFSIWVGSVPLQAA